MKGVPDGTETFVCPAGREGVAEATLHLLPRLVAKFPGPPGLGTAEADASVDKATRAQVT